VYLTECGCIGTK